MSQSKKGFEQTAGTIILSVNGDTSAVAIGTPRRFQTGSMGWNVNGKVVVRMPNGDVLKCQLTGNVVVIGSKDWDEGSIERKPEPAVSAPTQPEPLDPSKMTAEQRRELKKLLLAADRADKKVSDVGYAYQKYDVCQVNYGDGKGWLDFATISSASDAKTAVQNVDDPKSANNRYAWDASVTAQFRIAREGSVVYGG